MGVVECVQDRNHQATRTFYAQREVLLAIAMGDLSDVGSVNVFHHHKIAIVDFSGVVDFDNIRVVQKHHHVCLGDE